MRILVSYEVTKVVDVPDDQVSYTVEADGCGRLSDETQQLATVMALKTTTIGDMDVRDVYPEDADSVE